MMSPRREEEGDAFLENEEPDKPKGVRLPPWLKMCLTASCLVNLVLLVLQARHDVSCPLSSQILYSPAQEAVRYEITKFHRGFGHDKTIYQQDPSPEVDAAWKRLYNDIGIIRLPRAEAERLPNKTYPYVGDKGYYIAELAVFHQLHCVNAIRIALAKDYYQTVLDASKFDATEGSYGRDHINHCVDAVREAIMCASDISVITWAWNDRAQKALGHGDIVHSCRSFTSIRDWSARHAAVVGFDGKVFVEDDLLVPEF